MTSTNAIAPHLRNGESYRLSLPNTARSAAIARDFATSLLTGSPHGGIVDDARLCVTEVVTNAHRHTRTSLIGVHVTVDPEHVTFAVSDDRPWTVPPGAGRLSGTPSGGEREGGWGLFLLEELASAWGSDVCGCCDPRHKTVWFTFAAQSGIAA
ncbi:ATP-binding protein [Streptomyces sp. NBC_01423]|uniref:ATP-binding protein n=1 Tax=Streptomyces sp. NBC_01423 TaxID=2903860 RepID=UPI002E280B67|nr:ATP-binding protein [Streptomyces sp. NBC_01423]